MENEILDNIENNVEIKRPILITIICILGIIGAAFTILLIFSDEAKAIGNWYPPYLAFSAITGCICFIGFWLMKKWSLIVYIGFVALNQIVLYMMNVWNYQALLIPLIFIVLIGTQFNKMK